MNKQIAKFANESGFDVDKTGTFGNYSEIHRLEKFAELIVRECAGVTLDYKNHDHYTGWCDHASEILKHFGVEE
jgi:hypothetical protein